jgi:hypothetical protein
MIQNYIKIFDEHNEDHNRSKNCLSRILAIKVPLSWFVLALKAWAF